MNKKILILILSLVFTSEYDLTVPFNSKSEISYTGSHPAHSWTGVSDNFKGGIVCNGLDDCSIKIQAPIDSFDSGSSSRDSNMLYYVESNKYRYVTFYSKPFSISDDMLLVGGDVELMGLIDFHGVEKEILFSTFIYPEGQFLRGKVSFDIYLSYHRVDRPSLLFVPISDRIIIKCDLYCLIDEFRSYAEK